MKKITDYIKSKSIREYYEKNNIKLNIIQAAFIILHNEDILFNEKLECYKNIADTYDDMSVDTIESGDIHSIHIDSFKQYLYKIIETLKNNYKTFINNSDDYIYSIGYAYLMKDIHNSYDETINHIKSNRDKYKKELKNGYISIYKINNKNKNQVGGIVLNSNLEVINVCITKNELNISAIINIFYYIYIEMPHPFKRGDIVKEIYTNPSYYCIDVMNYWDEATLKENKVNIDWFTPMDEKWKKKYSYPECMDFAGYFMNKRDKKKFNGAETIFTYCLGDNPVYFDLEFVEDNELKGYYQILKLCKEYIRRIVNNEDQLTPLSIIGYYKEIEAIVKGNTKFVYNNPEDAYYHQYSTCPQTYL